MSEKEIALAALSQATEQELEDYKKWPGLPSELGASPYFNASNRMNWVKVDKYAMYLREIQVAHDSHGACTFFASDFNESDSFSSFASEFGAASKYVPESEYEPQDVGDTEVDEAPELVWLAEFCQTAKRHGRMAGKMAISEDSICAINPLAKNEKFGLQMHA
ncbi:hypothetical protein B0H10DRAFT_1953935 [Mycena sp. CBHHK59/15]|nr:hypothetical protein B0H10DRAFT_1953935 [Mycena sp. CBHHK59/15]